MTELSQREKLIDRIEGYYGPMNNIHKLSTDELNTLYCSVLALSKFSNENIIRSRNNKK